MNQPPDKLPMSFPVLTAPDSMFKNLFSILALIVLATTVQSEATTLHIELEPTIENDGWVINYQFSDAVDALNFESTPYGFLSSDWEINQDVAAFDFSKLHLKMTQPGQAFRVMIKGFNDAFYRGFYTPFLNFSDGGTAIYIGHYLPRSVNIANQWVALEDITTKITINNTGSSNVIFAGKNNIKQLELKPKTARQYAYIGPQLPAAHQDFNLIMDDQLPEWIRREYQQFIPKLFNYYQNGFKSKLTFKPLFMVNYKSADNNTRLDGGAINQQIAINFIGSGWQDGEAKNLINVQSLLAHEMAHLWNAQFWQSSDERSKPWLHEGSANYFAYQSLLALGYMNQTDFEKHLKKQQESCALALQQAPINQFKNRKHVYACGEVLFNITNQLKDRTDAFGFWHEMQTRSPDNNYSQQHFVETFSSFVEKPSLTTDLKSLLDINTDNNTNYLIKLIQLK